MSDRCCEGVRPLKFSRRYFLKQGGIAMVGLSAMPAFLQRAVAATPTPSKKQFVVLFQRGAADGLNIVVPFARAELLPPAADDCDSAATAWRQPRRPSISTDFSDCIRALAPLEPLFHKNQLAIVHAAGSPDPTRSHFDAQDFMESGTPGVKATDDGWLNRAIETVPEENASPFRAVAMGPNLPRMLHGKRVGDRAAGFEAVQGDAAIGGDGRRGGGRLRSDVRADRGSRAARHRHGNV